VSETEWYEARLVVVFRTFNFSAASSRTSQRTQNVSTIKNSHAMYKYKHIVPWPRPPASGLWPWGTGFDVKSVHVRFMTDEVATGQVLLRVFQFSPAITIPPLLHSHLHLHVALTRRSKERSLRTSRKRNDVAKFRERGVEKNFQFYFHKPA
jgi:hypothetical protein